MSDTSFINIPKHIHQHFPDEDIVATSRKSKLVITKDGERVGDFILEDEEVFMYSNTLGLASEIEFPEGRLKEALAEHVKTLISFHKNKSTATCIWPLETRLELRLILDLSFPDADVSAICNGRTVQVYKNTALKFTLIKTSNGYTIGSNGNVTSIKTDSHLAEIIMAYLSQDPATV